MAGEGDYGRLWASIYDQFTGARPDLSDIAAVEFLAARAASGPALELGVGTGRVAIPLAQRGIEVHGIDASPEMIAILKSKQGGDRVKTRLGTFAQFSDAIRYRLIFAVYNTFFWLLDQKSQLDCLRSAAQAIGDEGCLILELQVPQPLLYPNGQRFELVRIGDGEAELRFSRHDAVAQRIDSLHTWISRQGVDARPVSIRYAWPAELDLMARVSGLRLEARWGGWRNEEFTSASLRHISIYRPAPS